jgi:hypothetical protein
MHGFSDRGFLSHGARKALARRKRAIHASVQDREFMALMPVPLGVMTLMLPLLAPDGTLNLILLALSMVTDRCLDLARESCNAQAYEYDCFRCAFELRGAARTN